MALQIRRGLAADRTSFTPASGELIYTTDTKIVYVGDGSTAGGVAVTGTGSGGVSDGDKGDITVSSSGTVWTIDSLAVTNAKINDVAWSKVSGTPTTLAGYGITDAITSAAVAAGYQPLDSDLTAIAALSTTSFGRSLLTQADAAATRTTIGAGTSNFDGAYASLSGIPSTFTPASHNQAWSTITSTPTTLSGYGITDAVGTTGDQSIAGVKTLTDTLHLSITTITYGATMAIDAATANKFAITLAGNGTISNPTNAVDGRVITFRLRQDGGGSRIPVWDTKYRFAGDLATVTLSTTGGAIDRLAFEYDATDDRWDCISFIKGTA